MNSIVKLCEMGSTVGFHAGLFLPNRNKNEGEAIFPLTVQNPIVPNRVAEFLLFALSARRH